MNKIIKWGVLGYARIAENSVIPAILRASNSEFYGIASRNEEKLQVCQQKFHCQKTYTTYDALLDDPDIQAVYIPLPNALHKEWTIKAAKKGKHILCEKPIALTTKEALEMIEECNKNNVLLMEAFMYRYTDRVKKIKEVLDSNVLGEIRRINSSFAFFLDRPNTIKMESSLGGGSLYDVGCYPINFIRMITNSSPISMVAEYNLNNGVDTSFSAVLKYSNGLLCTLHCGFDSYFTNYSEIIGTQGSLQIPDTFQGKAGMLTLTTSDGIKEIPVEESDRYRLEVEDFADAILNNRKPHFSYEDTIRNMEVIDQLLDNTYRK